MGSITNSIRKEMPNPTTILYHFLHNKILQIRNWQENSSRRRNGERNAREREKPEGGFEKGGCSEGLSSPWRRTSVASPADLRPRRSSSTYVPTSSSSLSQTIQTPKIERGRERDFSFLINREIFLGCYIVHNFNRGVGSGERLMGFFLSRIRFSLSTTIVIIYNQVKGTLVWGANKLVHDILHYPK